MPQAIELAIQAGQAGMVVGAVGVAGAAGVLSQMRDKTTDVTEALTQVCQDPDAIVEHPHFQVLLEDRDHDGCAECWAVLGLDEAQIRHAESWPPKLRRRIRDKIVLLAQVGRKVRFGWMVHRGPRELREEDGVHTFYEEAGK